MTRFLAVLFVVASLMTINPAAADERRAHDFTFTGIDGRPLPLSDFRGKVLLVVNTASECGYTGQYDNLETLWQTYRGRGLVVIGVPSNDFGGQEPGTAEEIANFCKMNYGVTFPLADKTAVSGDAAHPFYRWAGDKAGTLGSPKWNFHKYLIGRDGAFIDWFSTPTDPMAEKITSAVEAALEDQGS